MAYGRRNFVTYPSSALGGAVPTNGRPITSYRNKILAVLVVTSLYTAFLYQRG